MSCIRNCLLELHPTGTSEDLMCEFQDVKETNQLNSLMTRQTLEIKAKSTLNSELIV